MEELTTHQIVVKGGLNILTNGVVTPVACLLALSMVQVQSRGKRIDDVVLGLMNRTNVVQTQMSYLLAKKCEAVIALFDYLP